MLGARRLDVPRAAQAPVAPARLSPAPEKIRASLACGHAVDVVGAPETVGCPWCRARVPVAVLVVPAHPSQLPAGR